jgi:hypothetical protein
VRYFATASGPRVREAMTTGLLDQIVTPAAGNAITPGATWCADNGVFGGTYPGDGAYLAWLADRRHLASTCRFVVAPDVVRGPDGELAPDAAATLARSAPMLAQIRALGFPAALVAQNGLEDLDVPWDTFDVLFIGGDDAWKEGPAAATLAAEAKARGKRVHMGRVNSLRRLRVAQAMGCDSVDGTYLAFGPDRNLPTLLSWLREMGWPVLFDMEARS